MGNSSTPARKKLRHGDKIIRVASETPLTLQSNPSRFICLTDGESQGEEHILVFLRPAGGDLQGHAIDLEDARNLLISLRTILAEHE